MRASLISLIVLAFGCSGTTPSSAGKCSANSDCASGEICDSGDCIPLCASDLQCASGEICVDSLCVAGERDGPSITAVDGDGTEICPDAGGTHCMLAGLIVEGTNLAGAAFHLTPESGGSTELIVRDGATDAHAVVDLPDVPPGLYVLTAANQVGSADQQLQLLQGPPGEDFSPGPNELVDLVNGATNFISIARLPHDHDAADISSGVIDAARLPGHSHAFTDIGGTADIGQLPTGTAATEVAVGDHVHSSNGSCYTHWGAQSCAAGFDNVMVGRTGGHESYVDSGGAMYGNVECVSASATAVASWGAPYSTRLMRGDADADGMQALNPLCSICCTGGCYTALGTSTCAAGYTRVVNGRTGGIEAYNAARIYGKTLCIDLSASATNTWASGYNMRLMRHRNPVGGATGGMQQITNACAVCCK